MKILRLDAHDRLEHLKKDQQDVISQGCEDCLKKNPDSLFLQSRCHYVYVFGHPRTIELDERIAMFNEDLKRSYLDPLYIRKYDTLKNVPNQKFLWQPRLSKPKAQTNSYLFRAKSQTDTVEICWFIPPRELWDEFKQGNVTESEHVIWSIDQFMNNREQLEFPFPDDISEEAAKPIWLDLARTKEEQVRMKKMYSTPKTEEPYLSTYWKS